MNVGTATVISVQDGGTINEYCVSESKNILCFCDREQVLCCGDVINTDDLLVFVLYTVTNKI